MQMNIKRNIEMVRAEIGTEGCQLIVVSKTQPVERVQEAYDAGQRLFGENKVQELTSKQEVLPSDIQWHLIGHLQSNKVKYIAPFVALIHSVDSEKLMAEIDKQGRKIDRVIPCLLQIHIATEETKFGFDRQELMQLIQGEKKYPNVKVQGLMGMASFTSSQDQVRQEFSSLRKLFEEIRDKNLTDYTMKELSMGMSSDYRLAIEEGSTLVRIGTAIFGERNYQNP